jgi:hypothetical protein
LVKAHWGEEATARSELWTFPGGAALAEPGPRIGRAWVLIDDGSVARFGSALAWAWRRGVRDLDVLVHEAVPSAGGASGVVARRAGELARVPAVWSVDGRRLSVATPAPRLADMPAPTEGMAALIESRGAEAVWEHGVLRGEVLGLEVARVVDGRLVVGVGRHDRMARAEMRPGEDVHAALDEVVAAVRDRRRYGEPSHPANTLARSRWLRSVLCCRPSLVGADRLAAVPPPLPWFDLPEAGAAPAVGEASRRSVVVVSSVGVDLDLVPTAADCRVLHSPGADLLLAMPERDDVAVTRALAGALAHPATVVTVPGTWESLGA